MKKIILSLLLLCSLATYADTYYSQCSEMWDPWMDEWIDPRYKKVKIEITDTKIIIYDDYKLCFHFIYNNGLHYTDDGIQYLDCMATMESDYFNICFLIYKEIKKMDIVIFRKNTDEGLVYHVNLQ